MIRADTVAVFREAAKVLDEAGVKYALTGANALGAYTLGRATYDIDLIVEKTELPLDAKLRGLQLVEKTKDVFFDQEAFIFEVATYVTPVEMFVATHWLTRVALERRRFVDIPQLGHVPVVRADDAALLKVAISLRPERASKRAVDLEDLRRLREAEPEVDVEHLRASATRLGPDALAALRQAGFAL